VRHKDHASRIHNEVARKVRQTIHELGGTMQAEIVHDDTVYFCGQFLENRDRDDLKELGI
jgi:hypothetical protein